MENVLYLIELGMNKMSNLQEVNLELFDNIIEDDFVSNIRDGLK